MEAVAPDRRLAGRYVLEAPIATGGMAAVWSAKDMVLARRVAVKMLREDLAEDRGLAERFHREAIAAAALTHPHVISVFDTGTEDGIDYIVMELFPGRPFSRLMSENGPVRPAAAADVLLPTLQALGFAHQQGLVHRDVKPGNILVDEAGWVKVTDFGIAKAAYEGRDLTTTGALIGTVRYISPEQVQGLAVDGRSDLYSAGVVLYEALAGHPPFQAETDIATAMMRLTQEPPPPSAIRSGIPRGMDEVVLRAMARDPSERYPEAGAMQAALHRFGSRANPASVDTASLRTRAIREKARAQPIPRRASLFRSWMLVPLVLLLVVGVAIGTGLLEVGGPLGVRPGGGAAPSTAPALARIPIDEVVDVDPEGQDGAEHPQDASLATDGDLATAWSTDHYASVDFGRLKDGVGLWLAFRSERTVSRVVLRSSIPGWSFQLLPGNDPRGTGDPLASRSGARTFTVDASGRAGVTLRPVSTSGILIWITRLAPDEGRFAAAIAEVSVQGSPS
jgi:serine/threonine-protein kinase